MKPRSEVIRDLSDDHLAALLQAMRRFSERGHHAYNINIHLAYKDECERRGLDIQESLR